MVGQNAVTPRPDRRFWRQFAGLKKDPEVVVHASMWSWLVTLETSSHAKDLVASSIADSSAQAASRNEEFSEWLHRELRSRRMSQRQLAERSGVNHTTISRMIRERRMPSLTTATKIARVLVDVAEDGRGRQFVRLVSGGGNPFRRVEFALRADVGLGEPQVRMVMDYYLAVRARHPRPPVAGHATDCSGSRCDCKAQARGRGSRILSGAS
jgi:transcriptional regulator with XRE-family HTH domain